MHHKKDILQVNQTKNFLRYKKKYLKNKSLYAKIEKSLELLESDNKTASLQYKKINCKHDKQRHSIRVVGTQYRILMSVYATQTDLQCICDHDEYDYQNKNC